MIRASKANLDEDIDVKRCVQSISITLYLLCIVFVRYHVDVNSSNMEIDNIQLFMRNTFQLKKDAACFARTVLVLWIDDLGFRKSHEISKMTPRGLSFFDEFVTTSEGSTRKTKPEQCR